MEQKQKKIEQLEQECKEPDFWENRERAAKISQKLSNLKQQIQSYQNIKQELEDLEQLTKLSRSQELEKEIRDKVESLEPKLEQQETKTFLSGKYDKRAAVLSIYSGAGGQDAEDWAAMLLRMYQRYCQSRGFKTKVLNQSFGEPSSEGRVGIKKATLEIKGDFSYGLLKKESGVHRLVRISPFSAQDLRHTSFARVEVLPVLPKSAKDQLNVKSKNLRVDTYRASGPGGQYVNRRESAVRITHLPTKVTVSCQSERLQGLNKKKAMEQLYSKLYQLKQQQREKKLSQLKQKKSAEFGNQIRSYVLDPYQKVSDHRTGVETSNIEAVLDGNLDQFIEAEVKRFAQTAW